MTQIVELSDRKLKITMINMLWALMEKVDNINNTNNVSREIETLGMSPKEMLEIKTVALMKNGFNGLISRFNTPQATNQ